MKEEETKGLDPEYPIYRYADVYAKGKYDKTDDFCNKYFSCKEGFVAGAKSIAAKDYHTQGMYTEAKVRTIATEFFYWWYNSPGENTEEGFDTWWNLNKEKYGKQEN